MQGRLRRERLTVTIETACGHCGWPMRFTAGSDMEITLHEGEAGALVFMPDVDWRTFAGANIIDAY